MVNNENEHKRDFKRIFNMNYVLSQIINYAAYLILIGSILVLTYLSFVETISFNLDWKTITIFAATTVAASWLCWNTFYHKQYEKLMDDDIEQHNKNKYSIHKRYYDASKDWTDAELQIAIDNFNEEYTQKWLRWVEKTTGVPIETVKEKYVDENGKEQIKTVLGIKERPYRGFKHKVLMWRVKNHKYPKSGYKTSMELLSLFSYQDANFNKRNLRADKHFYIRGSITKLLSKVLLVFIGASLIPEMVKGEYWTAILKLILAVVTLISSVLMGAMNGVRGARLKLSIVEDACADMERWANKKPALTLYEEQVEIQPEVTKPVEEKTEESFEENQVITQDIFHKLNISKS